MACGLLALLLAQLCRLVASTQVVRQPLAEINADLQAGEADKALALLESLPHGGSNIAQAKFLECRVRYALEQWDAAASACEQAVQLDGQNSSYHMWLGRALGEKAEQRIVPQRILAWQAGAPAV